MWKKMLAGASAVVLGMSVASDAMAECDGIYLGIRGGVASPDIKYKHSKGDHLDFADDSLMLSGAIGYRYTYFRAEFEYIWRDKSEETKTTVIDLGRPNDPEIQKTSRTFDYESYMFNVYYDLAPYSWFTPYLQAGLGMTNLELKHIYPDGSIQNKERNFTWVLGGGISAKLTNRLNADIGYRYFDMGKMSNAEIKNHEFYGGLRYIF